MKAVRFSIIAAGTVAMLYAASGVAAQLEGGYRKDLAAEPQGRFLSPKDQARATLDAYAHCLVEARRVDVDRALALPPGDLSDKALRNVAISNCLSFGALKFAPDVLRGALYIDLYRRKFPRSAPAMSAQPIDFGAGIPPSDEQRDALIVLREFADCAARIDPTDAREVVVAAVGSKEEEAAYAGLAPHLNQCLHKGQQVKFTKAVLSGLIAEVLFREAALDVPSETH